MGQLAHLEEQHHNQTFAMAPKSYTTHWSPCINLPTDILEEQDELAGARSDAGSDEALTFSKTPTPPLVPSPANNFFIKFMKMFMETIRAQALAEH